MSRVLERVMMKNVFFLCWLTEVEKKLSGILSNAFSIQLFRGFPIFVMNIKLCSEERTLEVLGTECIFLLKLMVQIHRLTLGFI